MTTSKELLTEILDLVDQSIAIRKAITLDMPPKIFGPLNKAALHLVDLADNKVEDALANGNISEQDRLVVKVAIDRVFNMDLRLSWR